MNTFLLLKVKEAILANPEHFDMSLWACGTAACICGWTAKLAGEYDKLREMLDSPFDIPENYPAKLGARLLKIDVEQAEALFLSGWPVHFLERYTDAEGDRVKRAQVVAEAIDDFIAHDGNWHND